MQLSRNVPAKKILAREVAPQHICISEFKVVFAGSAHVCVQCLISVS
jgi:hypothetical protein